jgi:hypothetical protein
MTRSGTRAGTGPSITRRRTPALTAGARMVAAAAIRGNVAEDYTPTDQRAGHSILWWDDTGQCPREGYQGRRFQIYLW